MWVYFWSRLLLISAINSHPQNLLDSLVLILLIIEHDICFNTEKYKVILLRYLDLHDKDLWNGPEKKYEIIRK